MTLCEGDAGRRRERHRAERLLHSRRDVPVGRRGRAAIPGRALGGEGRRHRSRSPSRSDRISARLRTWPDSWRRPAPTRSCCSIASTSPTSTSRRARSPRRSRSARPRNPAAAAVDRAAPRPPSTLARRDHRRARPVEAIKYLMAGADVVMSTSALLQQGPPFLSRLLADVSAGCRRRAIRLSPDAGVDEPAVDPGLDRLRARELHQGARELYRHPSEGEPGIAVSAARMLSVLPAVGWPARKRTMKSIRALAPSAVGLLAPALKGVTPHRHVAVAVRGNTRAVDDPAHAFARKHAAAASGVLRFSGTAPSRKKRTPVRTVAGAAVGLEELRHT